MGRLVVAPLLGAAIVVFDVACTRLPGGGQQFLSLPGTNAEPFTTCVRVAGVSTSLVQRATDAFTAEQSAIAELAAAAAEAGGNFVRVECATWSTNPSHPRVALTGSAYRCAQAHSTRSAPEHDANAPEGAPSFECVPTNDGLLTCTRSAEPDLQEKDGYSNELKNVTRAVAPPPDLPPVDCGVGIHDGFYTRAAIGLQATILTGRAASLDAVPHTGVPMMVALGGTPTSGLVVGGAARVGFTPHAKDRPSPVSAFDEIGVLVDWFPDPKGGAHVGAIAGAGGLSLAGARGVTSRIAPSGTILLGYDGWVSEQGSVGAFVALTAATSSAVHVVAPGVSADAAPLAISLEASFTYH